MCSTRSERIGERLSQKGDSISGASSSSSSLSSSSSSPSERRRLLEEQAAYDRAVLDAERDKRTKEKVNEMWMSLEWVNERTKEQVNDVWMSLEWVNGRCYKE